MTMEHLARMAQAVEDNWCAAWLSLGAVRMPPLTHAEQTHECVRVYTPGAPEMLLNMMIRYHSQSEVGIIDIERTIEPYRRHRLPFQWWLTLGSEPAGLRQGLRALGMQSWGGATSMVLDLAGWESRYPPPGSHVRVGRVATSEDARAALRVICDVFFVPSAPMARWTIENPAFQVYCAHLGGRLVAALATLRQGTTVGVYHVATLAGARRRGIAGNLLVYALREAQRDGCTLSTLTATPEARHLYEQLGYRTCGTIEQWIPGPALTNALLHGWAGSLAP